MTEQSNLLLKPNRPVGIIGYGAYVPRYRLPAKEVARVWTGGKGGQGERGQHACRKQGDGEQAMAHGGSPRCRGFVDGASCPRAGRA